MAPKALTSPNENIVADEVPSVAHVRHLPVSSRARERRTRSTFGAQSFEDMLRDLVRDVVHEELSRTKPVSAEENGHLSTRAAARHAGVAMGTIRRWIREGRLREQRAGRHLRVRRIDIDALLAGEGNDANDASPEELARKAFGA